MKKNTKLWIVAAAALTSIGLAFARDEMPWTFNNGHRPEGYTIDLVSVSPEPGTPLVAGETVDFKVTVRYENKVAPKANVVLVFQVENGSAKPKDEPQVMKEVTDKSGTVTLEDRLTIPKKEKQLLLFVPLVPDGMNETDGEVVVRYPIKKK